MTLDRAAQQATVEVTLDMTAINTGSKRFDEHIQSSDMFDTAQFPKATFKSTDVIFDKESPSTIHGELTIKGITKPVTLNVSDFVYLDEHPMSKKPVIAALASTKILRSEFDAGYLVPAVGDEVRIEITLEAIAD